jgi:hypothetical protein
MSYAKYYLAAQRKDIHDKLSGRYILREAWESLKDYRIAEECIMRAAESDYRNTNYDNNLDYVYDDQTEAVGNAGTVDDGQGKKGIRVTQIEELLALAKVFKYDPLDIPVGGKAIMKKSSKMTKDSFNAAWIEAGKRGVIRIHNKIQFLEKQ